MDDWNGAAWCIICLQMSALVCLQIPRPSQQSKRQIKLNVGEILICNYFNEYYIKIRLQMSTTI